MTAKKRSLSVSFSEDIVIHHVPLVDDELKAILFYNKIDFHRFSVSNRLRKERKLSKRLQRLVAESKEMAMDKLNTPAPVFEMQRDANGIFIVTTSALPAVEDVEPVCDIGETVLSSAAVNIITCSSTCEMVRPAGIAA